MRTLVLLIAALAADPAVPPPEAPPPPPPWAGPSGYTMIRVSPGSFIMGSPEVEAGRNQDERRHDVRQVAESVIRSKGYLRGDQKNK